jgi:hypothetical protein
MSAFPSLLIGGLLLFLAIPELELMDAWDRAEDLASRDDVAPPSAEAARVEARALDAAAEATGQAFPRRAAMFYWSQAAEGASPSVDPDLERAVQDGWRSLSVSPMDHQGWMILAGLERRRFNLIAAVKAWNMSVRVGDFDPSIMASRASFSIGMWPYMDQDDRDVFSSQLLSYWDWRPNVLAHQLVGESAGPLAVLALKDKPKAQQDLSERLKWYLDRQ